VPPLNLVVRRHGEVTYMSLLRSALIAVAIYLAILVPVLISSGAQLRIELVDASALALGFLVPAFFIRCVSDLRRMLWLLVPWAALAVLWFDLWTAEFVVKRDPFMGWQVLYPIGVLFLLGLLLLHSWLVQKLTERGIAR
jgi:hypothetical protein